MKFTFAASLLSVSLLAIGALSTPVPAPSKHHSAHDANPFSKDQAGLTDSKRKPPLITNNRVITSDPNIVVRSAQPKLSSPPSAEARKQLGLDSLRGFVSQKVGENGVGEYETTIVVFNVPPEAKGKRCSFHFFYGSGDSNGQDTLFLWSLDGKDNWFPEEFKTTWDNKPYRNQLTAEIETGRGPKLTPASAGEGNDAKFNLRHTDKVKHLENVGNYGYKSFPCDPVVGKTAWELVAKPQFDHKGNAWAATSAWSMNKGLMIEVHGLPRLPTD